MMAQGGYSSTDEESEDIDDSFILPFMNPAVTFFEKQGDEKFQAKMYEEASMCYTAAMEEPIMPFIDISIISERLFRKRAGCFLKMGNYLDAIQDSEKAIQVANNHNNPNLAKSVYIKMKAIISLEDYPPAFPLALWYKHLLPNCEKTRAVLNDLKEKLTEEFTKDESLIDEVLFEMLSFAHGMTMDPDTLELALECYTELLDLLDFLIIPEVQLRQAKCLLQSGRCDEAKVACAKVLWFAGDNVDALSLMGEITRQIREREMRQAKEMTELQGTTWSPLEKGKEKNVTKLSNYTDEQQGGERQTAQRKEESPFHVVTNAVQKKKEDLDLAQVESVNTKEQGNNQRKKKRNKEKKKKKKARKKAQKKSASSPDLPPVSSDINIPSDGSLDEGDSQATASVIGDPDISSGSLDTVTSPFILNVAEVDRYEEPDGEEFIPVCNTRRLGPTTGNKISPDCLQTFGGKICSLDWIGTFDENPQSSDLAASKQPSSQPMEERSLITQRQSLGFGGATSNAITPVTAANVKPSGLTSQTIVASQGQTTFASVTSRNQVRDMSQTRSETKTFSNSDDYPTLDRSFLQVSASSSSAVWSTLRTAHQLPNESTLVDVYYDQSLRTTPVQPGSSTVSFNFSRPEQWQRSLTPAPIIHGFQKGGIADTINAHVYRLTGSSNHVPIPEKVFVVCGHFLSKRPTCDYAQAKTCQYCEDSSFLHYAIWNDIHHYWQVIRPFPVGNIPPNALLDLCRDFAAKTSCRKEPCSYAHGDIEKHLWEKQREGSLPTPKESLRVLRSINASATTKLITEERDTSFLPLQTVIITECVTMASFTTSTGNAYTGVDAVASQSKITSLPLRTATDFQLDKPSTFSHIPATPVISAPEAAPTRPISYQSPSKDGVPIVSPLFSSTTAMASGESSLPLQFLPASDIKIQEANSKGNTSSTSSLAEETENPIAPIGASVKPTNTIPKVQHLGTVLSHTQGAERSTASTWSSSSENTEIISAPVQSSAQTSIKTSQGISQSGIPSQSTAAERSTNSQPLSWSNALKTAKRSSKSNQKTTAIPTNNYSNDYRKVPAGIYVVCDHFLKENLQRPASVSHKAKPCKGCENRSKLKYAFWSVIWKRWEEIRPYPKDVKIRFKVCRLYSKRNRCLKIPCSFAHGEQELTMWTMEREGVLPTPRESLTGSFSGKPSASAQKSSAMQPLSQLLHRPSPPGVTNGSYRLCKSCNTRERCRFGRGCIYAHSQHELNEWKQEYDRKLKEKLEKDIKEREELFSSEMASKILNAPSEDRVECLAGVEVICSPPELNVSLREKGQYKWTFTLSFKPDEVGSLQNVFLLHRYHSCYLLSEIRVSCIEEKYGSETYKLLYTTKLEDSWYKSPSSKRLVGRVRMAITVSFESPLYGSFEQLVVFDFGRKPYLIKKLNADFTSEPMTLPSAPEHLASHAPAIWDERSVEVVRFIHATREALQAEHLSRKYGLPRQVDITDELLSPKIYKNVMHQLLFLEERFMKEQISRYTLNNAQLHAQLKISGEMTGMQCAVNGELFGVLRLHEEDALKPDDAAGRLLYRNVNSVWLQLASSESKRVYEAPVEKVESDCVVLRLPSKLCSDLKLHDTCDVSVNAQFQLNRWPLCQLHEAVERLTSGQLRLIFPDPTVGTVISEVKIPWQWLLDKRLNPNQQRVIKRIASLEDNALPLVVFGPFGTGKTFTLSQCVRLLVQLDRSHRILLCTHSNRAADIHVEWLHNCGIPAARPLRVYQPMRRLETTSKITRQYCLIKDEMFVLPCRDDVIERRVVVTTLSTSQVLLDLDVLHGFFTHILIDEAAQALEPEALNPLKFAGTNTKIVFTGDHMQMSPEVYSPQARSLGLQKSLAERLFDLYEKYEAEGFKKNPSQDEKSNVFWLTENYRCNELILKFPSENFYGKKLIARGHESQPAHPKYGPLLFFSARGKETKEQDNSYLNLSEVYEVEKRVKEIADNWPTVWGPKNLSDIAVLSSYRYQVQAIRKSLRKVKLRDVKVDTIHNVQGEEFRVLFISTVRTFHTCKPQQEEFRNGESGQKLYWEFLSDPKLLNTAVTRARCMVAVVGDPVSLCVVGECRGLWRDYIKRCAEADGLFGTTMKELLTEISASIANVQLNPAAKMFIPSFIPKVEKSLSAKAPEEKTIESAQEDVYVKELMKEKNVGKVLETESDTRESSSQQILSGRSAVNDALDSKNQPILILKDQDQGEEDPDDDNADLNDFQDSLLEDETVFPRDMDEIIQAFVQKCEETLKMDEERKSIFDESEFPSLQAVEDLKQRPIAQVQHPSLKSGADIKDLFPEVRVINGRIEVRLTNLGCYRSPSERAKQIMISSKQQDFFDPSVLMQLIADKPEKYIVCNLRLSPEKLHVGYAEVEDTKTPSIHIKGKLRQAFHRDKVVIELAERKARSKADETEPAVQGRVVGVLEHIISPHERQFVCTTDYANPAVMVPINKAATKLVNLTDKTCDDIPMYRKDHNGRAIKVKMFKREKVLSGKYLFVVKYLQWRRDFSNPLGIVVRTLSRGHDLRTSMEIAYAEHGVRREFKEQTLRYVDDNFPPGWTIPEVERNNRTKVSDAITIDPPTSLDLDDALTIENVSPSTFLLGIHIADASFFVRPNTPLDDEAFSRCSSYYPQNGHENVPMLPRQLSENFCSLLPNEDRLAVSVFVTINGEGKLLGEPKIKRTVVRSCCRLNYAKAQMIIDEKNASTSEIPEEIKGKVRRLSSLAQKRRFHRLRDRAFDHWQNEGKDFEAHELVEEWMILANEEIAKLLSQKNSELAPLKIQLPPKDHRLAEWIQMYGKYARMSLTLSAMFTKDAINATPLDAFHDESIKFKIQTQVWRTICQAVESNDFPTLQYLICNESNHPQIATAVSHFRRIQSESRCVCEGDQPPENICHYSLGIPRYTQFTSPIRRYIDIVVHRLLIGLVLTSSTNNHPTKDEVLKVCRRHTFMQDNARKFEKYCKRIHLATQLQQRCRETRVFIESIQHQSLRLQILNREDDLLATKNKTIALRHLNLLTVDEKKEYQGEEQSIILKWKIRKYMAPDFKRNTTELSISNYKGVDEVIEIPPDVWVSVLDMIRANDKENLVTTIKKMQEKLSAMPYSRRKDTPAQTSFGHVHGIHYKHPHHNDEAQPSTEATVDHFYEKKVTLRKYDFLSVQLCPRMIRGILEPDIQVFKVDAHLNVCIEHRKYPRESFSHTARHQASRERYESIDEYVEAWKPVIAMEAATEAVKENDGFTIENLNVLWKHKADSVRGEFELPFSYCDSRQLNFHMGDLVCIRMSYCEISPSSVESESHGKSSKDGLHSDSSGSASDFWVAHCIIKSVRFLKEKRMVKVKMYLHQSASTTPEGLSNEEGYRCTLELIHRTLPQRRMYAALCSLKHSSELVHAICRGEEPSRESYGELPTSLFLTQFGFKKLNTYQEAAVKEALCHPFTLIQGPPGTGKTVTGVHIAYWFAEQNKTKKSLKLLKKETSETECDGAHKSPPQVIYCGPSNKSVDVVTELLLKMPDLKVLRVYSDQIEQKEFPIPNKLKPARTTRSDDELKISSDQIRSVSLHHVIRGPECPHSEELRKYEEGFAQCKAMKETIGQKEVADYRKVIGLAEKWALQESGVQIILCTCAASGSPRIVSSCDNIQQCIVDECGMCMEPESLVPITCSGAKQVVLIGDHKQLQPVIQDHVAKTLGLSVSMFERHSKRATMLELQYRMHDGICEFPSRQFYDGKLRTADVVKSRVPSPISFWPAQRKLPIVFCHVEGQEESAAIATSESNEESKRNMKEVRKAVQIAKHLVNRYVAHVQKSDVVILSPYREQRSKITELLKGAYEDIKVTTITKSQGSEWDYVIISLVRSVNRDEIDPEPSLSWLREHLGFLTDEHQMNVGITRARRGLCIIGNRYLLELDPAWKSLIEHYEKNSCLVNEDWPQS